MAVHSVLNVMMMMINLCNVAWICPCWIMLLEARTNFRVRCLKRNWQNKKQQSYVLCTVEEREIENRNLLLCDRNKWSTQRRTLMTTRTSYTATRPVWTGWPRHSSSWTLARTWWEMRILSMSSWPLSRYVGNLCKWNVSSSFVFWQPWFLEQVHSDVTCVMWDIIS